MNLVRRYQKYSPLITAPCVMNILCKEFENVDFDINFNKNAISMLPSYEDEFLVQEDRLKVVKELYRKYSARKQVKVVESILENLNLPNRDEYDEIRFLAVDTVREEIREVVTELKMEGKEFLFYCSELAKGYRQFNWDFAWDVLGDSIVDFIPKGNIRVPVKSEEGLDYLGGKYLLSSIEEEVFDAKEELLDYDFDSVEDLLKVGLENYEDDFVFEEFGL